MTTVQDYIRRYPQITPTREELLLTFEKILTEKGYDWLHVPQEAWEDIYKAYNKRSPDALANANSVIRDYYIWLASQGVPPDPPYPELDFAHFFASTVETIYPPSVFVLLDWDEEARAGSSRSTAYTKLVNQAFLVLLWRGFSFDEIIKIQSHELSFRKGSLDIRNPSSAESFDTILIREVHYASQRLNNILYSLWKHSVHEAAVRGVPSLPLCLSEKNQPFPDPAARARLKRCLDKINQKFGVQLTSASIKQAGALERAYHYWVFNHRPWVYSYPNMLEYYKAIGEKPAISLSAMQAEFQRFIEYARNVQKHIV